MKTSAELQYQSYIRKLIYFGLIAVLFTVMTFSGRLVAGARGKKAASSTWTVSAQARTLQLTESDRGVADLAGATIRLALSGTRGFAITGMWLLTIEKQKKHEWNEVDFLINTITKLQPHFLTPWLFQSWNLAYNVSVESDRIRDKYFYIGRGIELLANGERINRMRGVNADGSEYELGNPDMRFWLGFYYANKFGISDENNTLRSLLQLSCINPTKRDPKLLRPDKTVDLARFREFVRQNPLLCRRLRESLRCSKPDDVVQFLAENARVPTRYEEIDGEWVLNRRPEEQFPVLPAGFEPTAEVASPYREFPGYFESFHCAWAWFLYGQQPLPPFVPGKPSSTPRQNPDPLHYRIPRQPAMIIFRQQPPRGLTYVAERLQKEGWFDESGWEVDEGRLTEQWFPGERLVVGNDVNYSAKRAWQIAHQEWEKHGKDHGLILTAQQLENLRTEAELYRVTHASDPNQLRAELVEDQVNPEMWRSYDAYNQLEDHRVNLQMSNFNFFLYRSQAEADDRTVKMRSLFHQAERLRGNRQDEALRLYEQAFALLTGGPAAGRQGILEAFPEFRKESSSQEELVEKTLTYLYVLEQWRGKQVRTAFARGTAIGAAGLGAQVPGIVGAMLYEAFPRAGELPSLFTGPLDGNDPTGEPWLNPDYVTRFKMNKGLIRNPTEPPPNAPSRMGVVPQP